MEVLLRLAKLGSMQGILQHASRLSDMDERYGPFASQLRVLAMGYQSKAILALVQDHLPERKQAELRQKLLLDEINHRVKNTLATVQAIATHTLRTAETPAEFVNAFEDRLLALSQAHNLLTLGNWQGADLREVLHQELAPHIGGNVHRIMLEGPDVRLDPVATVTFGMAFHEVHLDFPPEGVHCTMDMALDRVSMH